MSKSLNNRIQELENTINILIDRINDLSANTENKAIPPVSKIGKGVDKALIKPSDSKSGNALIFGGSIIWNDKEAQIPPINQQPDSPSEGYNKHTHSRYSGGALLKDALEIVEYDYTKDIYGNTINITNKHSQEYWESKPAYAKQQNSDGIYVNKIGNLDLVFNPDTQMWGVAALEIDVDKCYFVKRRTIALRDGNGDVISGYDVGDIELDDNGNEMRSPLYNEDSQLSSIVWDKNAQVWRLYAIYAPGE